MSGGGARPGEMTARLDEAMAAAVLAQGEPGGTAVAIDLHLNFMRGAAGALTASARITGGGRSLCFCEAELLDASGALVARAMGTYRRLAAPKSQLST